MEFDELSNRVIGCALEVHREMGPGLKLDHFVLFVFFVVEYIDMANNFDSV
jgi:hypothetical protein